MVGVANMVNRLLLSSTVMLFLYSIVINRFTMLVAAFAYSYTLLDLDDEKQTLYGDLAQGVAGDLDSGGDGDDY